MSITTPKLPHADTLAGALVRFFLREPEEMLSIEDISIKFDEPTNVIPKKLALSVQMGWLSIAPKTKGLYIPGPTLITRAAELKTTTEAQAPASAVPATSAPEETDKTHPCSAAPIIGPRKLAPIDVSAIKVEDNVPLTNAIHGPGQSYWNPLLDRLVKCGQASEPISRDYYGSLSKAAKLYAARNGRKFAFRSDSAAGTFRIHRVE